MELNGLANIKILIDQAVKQNVEHHQQIDPALADQILEQLNILERYLIALGDKFQQCAPTAYKNIPKWHEVKADLESFPTLREKIEEAKKELSK